jgi:hypothetical protein
MSSNWIRQLLWPELMNSEPESAEFPTLLPRRFRIVRHISRSEEALDSRSRSVRSLCRSKSDTILPLPSRDSSPETSCSSTPSTAIESARVETSEEGSRVGSENPAIPRGFARAGLPKRTRETRIRASARRPAAVFSVRDFDGSLSPSIRLATSYARAEHPGSGLDGRRSQLVGATNGTRASRAAPPTPAVGCRPMSAPRSWCRRGCGVNTRSRMRNLEIEILGPCRN